MAPTLENWKFYLSTHINVLISADSSEVLLLENKNVR